MTEKEIITQSLLVSLPLAKIASGGAELQSRCPFCGDSEHDRNKRSFYVSLKEDAPMMFLCFRASCGVKGILNSEILNVIGVHDIESMSAIIKHNSRVLSLPINRLYVHTDVYRIVNKNIEHSDKTLAKIKYISDRIGVELGYNDLVSLKIVPNLINLLKANDIKDITRHPKIVKDLDKHFVGFISQDNAFVTLRMITGEGQVHDSINTRYVNYNIFGKYDNTKKTYVIPTQINLNSRLPINIHLSEGIFDILSIYFNIPKPVGENIYASVNGSSFIGVIKYFILIVKLVNVVIHIYKDNDMTDEKIKQIADELYGLNIPLYVHTNTYIGEKDFGVPCNKINEYVRRLL